MSMSSLEYMRRHNLQNLETSEPTSRFLDMEKIGRLQKLR